MSRRALAFFLALVMCLSLVNVSVFSVDEEGSDPDWDVNIPLPPADPENEIQYPYPMEGFGQLLLTEYPKAEIAPDTVGVWSAVGTWEDGSPVMTIDENGNAVFFEPAGAEAWLEVRFTYEVAPAVPAEPEADGVVPEGEVQVELLSETMEEVTEAELTQTAPAPETAQPEPTPDAVVSAQPDAQAPAAPEADESADNAAEQPSDAEPTPTPDPEPTPVPTEEPAAPQETATPETPAPETVTLTWIVVVTGDVNLLGADTWASVKEALEKGQNVTLQNDIAGDSTITITENVKLDLNGHTMTFKGTTGSVIHVTDGTFTLNGTGGGKITGGKGTLIQADKTHQKTENGKTVTVVDDWKIGSSRHVVDTKSLNGYGAIIGDSRKDVTCGGAILLTGKSQLVMTGGAIDNNSAAQGGGICAFRGAKVTIYGGSITNNTASGYAGGGMFLGAKNNLIDPTKNNTPVTITGNKTNTNIDLGGGGIFVDSAGSLEVKNAVITNNKAGGLGGGVAGCLHGMVSNLSPDTAAVYGNKSSVDAKGTAITTHTLDNLVDHDSPKLTWTEDLKKNAQDYFVAGFSNIGSRSLGGGSATWSGNAVLRSGGTSNVAAGPVSTSKQDPIMVQGLLGLKVTNPKDVEAALKNVVAAKATISGNYSNMHGGGIGTNGLLTFGETNYAYTSSKVTLKASKVVSGAQGNDGSLSGFTFQLYNGQTLIGQATSDSKGNIVFANLSTSVLFGNDTTPGEKTATLTLKEVAGNKTGMTYDTTDRVITLKANRTVSDPVNVTTHGGGNHVSVATFSDKLKANGCSVTPGSLSVSGSTVTLNGDANFTNKMEYGDLVVTKSVKGPGDTTKKFGFTVTIGNKTETFELANDESKTFENIPVGTKYTVRETGDTTGYTKSGEVTTAKTIVKGNNSETVTNTRNTASLTVEKKVAALDPTSATPTTKWFTIMVDLGNGNGVWSNTYTWQGEGKYTFSLTDGAEATITGIPTGMPYTVREAQPDESGWTIPAPENGSVTATAGGTTKVVVNNSFYKVRETEVKVTKTWAGEGAVMPTSITVELVGGADPKTSRTQVLTAPDWSYSWGSLPAYDGNKQPYSYSVKETAVTYDDTVANAERKGNVYVVTKAGSTQVLGGWTVTESGLDLTNSWVKPTETGSTGFTLHKVEQGTNLPLAGARFTLTQGDKTIETDATDANGDVSVSGLTLGEWTMTETAAPAHHQPSDKTWVITVGQGTYADTAGDAPNWVNRWNRVIESIKVNGEDVRNEDGTLTVTNEIDQGYISVTKAVDFGTYDPLTGEAVDRAFTFRVYAGTDTDAVPVDTLTVKGGETQTTKSLPYGTYTVVEDTNDVTIGNYTFDKATINGTDTDRVTVTVGETNGATVAVNAVNHYTRQTSSLALTKTVNSPDAGDQTTDYSFTVKTLNRSLNGTFGGMTFVNGEANVTVRGGATVTADGIPVGTTYTVTENNKDASKFSTTGEVTAEAPHTVVLAGSSETVTNTRELKELTVGKTVEWNSTSMAPADGKKFTITVAFDNGSVVATDLTRYTENGKYVFELGNGEKATITGIPTGTAYTVTEDKTGLVTAGQEGYSYVSGDVTTAKTLTDNASETVVNHYYEHRYVPAGVTKTWSAGSDAYLPASVEVELLRDGKTFTQDGVTTTATLTAANGWTANWTGLREYDGDNGQKYVYTVKEGRVAYPEGSAYTVTDARDGDIIRVRSTVNKTEADVAEIIGGWIVADGKVDGEGKIVLHNTWRGANQIGNTDFTLTKTDSEKNVPIQGVTFQLYAGTVTYEQVRAGGLEPMETQPTGPDGKATFHALPGGTYTLVETAVPDAYKGVLDGEGKDVNLGRTWQVRITQGDRLLSVREIDKDGFLGENTWSWNANMEGGFTITNQIAKGSVRLHKALVLDGVDPGSEAFAAKAFTFEIRAEDVSGMERGEVADTMTVLGDGRVVTSAPLRYGLYTIVETGDSSLPDYDQVGTAVFSGLDDADPAIDGFQVRVDGEGKLYSLTATNTYQRHVGDLRLSKTVSGNAGEQTRDWHFLLTLKTPADYVQLAETYAAELSAPMQMVNEETGETTTQVIVTDIPLEKYVPAPVEGGGADDAEGLEPPVQEEGTITFQLTLKHGQSVLIKGLPVGTTYTVTEVEANQNDYATTATNPEGTIVKEPVTEAAFENSRSYFDTTTTNISVRKVWAGDDANERPASVTVQLLNGGTVYDTVTLSAATGWSHTWRDLDIKGEWSISEAEVPAGYTSAVTRNGNTFTVTNTYGDNPENPDIPEEDVPLADMPEDLFDEEVPLADLPVTGDDLFLWIAALVISGMGLIVLAVSGRKSKRDEEP